MDGPQRLVGLADQQSISELLALWVVFDEHEGEKRDKRDGVADGAEGVLMRPGQEVR